MCIFSLKSRLSFPPKKKKKKPCPPVNLLHIFCDSVLDSIIGAGFAVVAWSLRVFILYQVYTGVWKKKLFAFCNCVASASRRFLKVIFSILFFDRSSGSHMPFSRRASVTQASVYIIQNRCWHNSTISLLFMSRAEKVGQYLKKKKWYRRIRKKPCDAAFGVT